MSNHLEIGRRLRTEGLERAVQQVRPIVGRRNDSDQVWRLIAQAIPFSKKILTLSSEIKSSPLHSTNGLRQRLPGGRGQVRNQRDESYTTNGCIS